MKKLNNSALPIGSNDELGSQGMFYVLFQKTIYSRGIVKNSVLIFKTKSVSTEGFTECRFDINLPHAINSDFDKMASKVYYNQLSAKLKKRILGLAEILGNEHFQFANFVSFSLIHDKLLCLMGKLFT